MMKKWLEWTSTILVTLAACFLLWTEVQNRLRPAARPQAQNVKGRIDAAKVRHSKGTGRVALIEFTDYECPFCGEYSREVAPSIDKKLLAGTGRHIVFNFPLERIHPFARKAAEAAECANAHGHYWDMHQRLFADQQALNEEALAESGAAVGIDKEAFTRCLDDDEMAGQVAADLKEGKRLGVNSTPTFFVGTVDQDGSIQLSRRVTGALPAKDLESFIDSAVPAATASR